MHVHSTASALSKLGVQRSLALPECATEPEEVYELAKRRGMDFVTLTDHDTIAGALTLADRPDVFVSEELTAGFRGAPQSVHVLCYGITPDDHAWLQAHSHDVEQCAEYLHEHEITTALAHPFYTVAAPLTPAHRRRLAELFPIWETRNGARAKELNLPAFVYIETRGGTAIGGSDDHAGIDIGRTYTETPAATTPEEFLAHIRAGRAEAHGMQGSAAKWTHAAIALAIRSLGSAGDGRPDPGRVLKLVERVMRQGELRQGANCGDLGPEDARALLRAWIAGMELEVDERSLLALLQDGHISHADLYRRGCRIHERKLAAVVGRAFALEGGRAADVPAAAAELFEACLPTIPYAAASAFLGREKVKLTRFDGDRLRVGLVADGLGSIHGVTNTVSQIRGRGVPGFDVEVIGTDPDVDRRLSAVAEIDVPFYPGLRVGVPSLPAVVDALAEGRYDLIHLVSPGPAALAAWVVAGVLDMPRLGSYHTEFGSYAAARTGRPELAGMVNLVTAGFYSACDVVLSPSAATDTGLVAAGIASDKIGRWARGVELRRFDPSLRDPELLPGEVTVLYAGRLANEKGIDLLADAFLAASRHDPRLHLALAGGGPEEDQLRERLGQHATFLGWLRGEQLARAYASADLFVFPSRTDTFGQVVIEAQASGLPVVAVGEGGPLSLIEHRETGMLAEPDPDELATEVLALAADPALRQRLARAALMAVRERTWEASLEQLAAGYARALGVRSSRALRQAA